MKNYLSVSNLSTAISRIVPCLSEKKERKVKKVVPFVVLNSDNDYGFYVKRLVREISKYPELREQPKILRHKALKSIETGDLIVFGDAVGNIDYDYRVETNAKNLDHLDGRKFKVYDLINDFTEVLKRLRKYVEENSGEETRFECSSEGIRRIKYEERTSPVRIEIELNVQKKRPSYVSPFLVVREKDCNEKVTIFDNWVKVGYNQYDIYVDLFGREIVYIKGQKFFIATDRFGRRYLN